MGLLSGGVSLPQPLRVSHTLMTKIMACNTSPTLSLSHSTCDTRSTGQINSNQYIFCSAGHDRKRKGFLNSEEVLAALAVFLSFFFNKLKPICRYAVVC